MRLLTRAARPLDCCLKLTSGLTSFVSFFVLPHMSLRASAMCVVGINAFGALGLVALLAQRREERERRRASRGRGEAVPISGMRATSEQVPGSPSVGAVHVELRDGTGRASQTQEAFEKSQFREVAID